MRILGLTPYFFLGAMGWEGAGISRVVVVVAGSRKIFENCLNLDFQGAGQSCLGSRHRENMSMDLPGQVLGPHGALECLK